MADTAARIELEQGCDFEEQGHFKAAFRCYLKAAKRGNIEAQVNLANLYDDGKGCPQNPEKAVYWYKLAFRSGSPEAAYNLAMHYRQHGSGRWTQYWLEQAAQLGDKDARSEIRKKRKNK